MESTVKSRRITNHTPTHTLTKTYRLMHINKVKCDYKHTKSCWFLFVGHHLALELPLPKKGKKKKTNLEELIRGSCFDFYNFHKMFICNTVPNVHDDFMEKSNESCELMSNRTVVIAKQAQWMNFSRIQLGHKSTYWRLQKSSGFVTDTTGLSITNGTCQVCVERATVDVHHSPFGKWWGALVINILLA